MATFQPKTSDTHLERLERVIEKVNWKTATLDRTTEASCKRGLLSLRWKPVVELGQPVLDRVDRHDAEHLPAARARKEDVDEGDDLEGLAEPHAVRQDASESLAATEPLLRLNDVVVQEPDASDLMRLCHRRQLGSEQGVAVAVRVADVHQDVAFGIRHIEGVVDVESAVVWIFVIVVIVLGVVVVVLQYWLPMIVLDNLAVVRLAA